jgi:hypothetical protein
VPTLDHPPGEERLPKSFLAFLIASFSFSLASILRVMLYSARLHDQSSLVLLWPAPPAFDFYDYLLRFRFLHQPYFFSAPGYPWYYPAPGVFAYQAFYAFGPTPKLWFRGFAVFALAIIVLCVGAAHYLKESLASHGLSSLTASRFCFAALITSWPIYFSLQRGNMESVLWFLFAAAIWAIWRDHWMTGAVLLGIAASFKIYPVLCFALYLRPLRWKQLLAGLLAMAATTLLALRYIEPDILHAFHHVTTGIRQWTLDYSTFIDTNTLNYDHSLFQLVKLADIPFHHDITPLLHTYVIITAIVMSFAFLARVLWLPRVNQLLFLCTACVLLPPTSFDYTLQNLYIPWAAILVLILRKRLNTAWTMVLMILFAVEMAPMTFLSHGIVSINGPVKGVALLAMLGIAALVPLDHSHRPGAETSPFRWRRQSTEQEALS